MARTKAHTIDGEIEKFEIIFTPSGPELVEVFQQWELDDAGRMVDRQPPRRERVDPADLTPRQRGLLTALATLKDARKVKRFG